MRLWELFSDLNEKTTRGGATKIPATPALNSKLLQRGTPATITIESVEALLRRNRGRLKP